MESNKTHGNYKIYFYCHRISLGYLIVIKKLNIILTKYEILSNTKLSTTAKTIQIYNDIHEPDTIHNNTIRYINTTTTACSTKLPKPVAKL